MSSDPLATKPTDDTTTVAAVAASPAVISNRYELGPLLGSGGFGAVHEAHDRLLGRRVAIKLIRVGRIQSDSARHFVEEARTIAKLDHPHIVPVFDVGVGEDGGWIVMRFIDGRSLAQALSFGKLTLPEALLILTQTAAAVDHAHRRGVIHRDIKPANILLEKRETSLHAWLADFGIAKITSESTTTADHLVAGTPGYMSPEQVAGRRVDARSDIFALGCVAYEMLTGRRAFQASSYEDLVYKVVHAEPEQFADIETDAGPTVAAVLRRALAKSPDDRQATADAFALQLQEAQAVRKRRFEFRRRSKQADWDGRSVIAATDVKKTFGLRNKVLDGFSLNVPAGAMCALLGRNGCGKSTALRIMMGLSAPSAGSVKLFGRDPRRHAKDVLARVGYVAESFLGFEWMTVSDHLNLLARYYRNWDFAYASTLLGSLDLSLAAKIATLSRGSQTKVSLVSALAHKPELLILDDPSLGLDAIVLDEFFGTIDEARRRFGTTVLIASHNLPEVDQIATHVALMGDGKVFIADTLEAVKLRTRQVQLTFADDAPDMSQVANFKPLRVKGRRVSGVITDTGSAALSALKAMQPVEIEVKELSLRDIFVSFGK